MKDNKSKKGKKVTLIILLVVATLLLALVAAALILGKSLLSNINRIDGTEETLSQEEIDALLGEDEDDEYDGPEVNEEDVEISDKPADAIENKDHIINIMLVGQDRRKGQRRQRSDSMILCTIDTQKKTLTMTSFMRDLWVHIPGYYNERLNVPYAIGGFTLLNKTLEHQFGFQADHNIEVDFSGFEKIIDRIGGVSINLTKAEASYLNKGGKWSLSSGNQLLNGPQALMYARIRGIDNDFKRTNRQRTVINAILDRVRGSGVTELYALAKDLLPMITTDMKDSDIMGYILTVGSILPELEVVSQRVPMDGAYAFARIGGRSVLVMSEENLQKNKALVESTLNGQ